MLGVHCPVRMFADDTKLFAGVSTEPEAMTLQADLDALANWSDTWQLRFNETKCKVLHIGSANHGFQYAMGEHRLTETPVERDLGVQVDANLKFRQQAATAVATTTRVLAVIRRSFSLIDERTLPLLFKTLVRPHLEYGNLVWGPFNRADQKAVERVQRRATRMVACIRHRPYQERLRLLRLPSLYYRHRRGDMIQVYQMLHRGVDMAASNLLVLNTDGPTRGHPLKIAKPRASTRVRRSTFAVRIVNDWNGLPADVVCAPSLNSFKSRLDAHWKTVWYSIPD